MPVHGRFKISSLASAAKTYEMENNFKKALNVHYFNSFIVCQAKLHISLKLFATNYRILLLLHRKLFAFLFPRYRLHSFHFKNNF